MLRGGQLPGGRRVDVVLGGPTVLAALTPGTGEAAEVVDVEGHLLLPAPAEPRAHLDVALSADATGAPHGDLAAGTDSWAGSGPAWGGRHDRTRHPAVTELVDHGVTAG